MSDAGFGADVDAAVAEAVEANPTAAVARLFVERASARNDWSFVENLPEFVKQGEGGREILYAAVDALAGPAHRGRLHDLLQRFAETIRQTHRGWAKATGALTSVRDYAAAATWGADWNERKPDEPWMLHPLAIALRQLGRSAEAYKVIVYALDLPGEDTTTDDFRVWLAFEEAVEGRADRAERLLDLVDEEELDDVPRILHVLTRCLIDVEHNGRSVFAAARSRGIEAIQQYAPKEQDVDLNMSFQALGGKVCAGSGRHRPANVVHLPRQATSTKMIGPIDTQSTARIEFVPIPRML